MRTTLQTDRLTEKTDRRKWLASAAGRGVACVFAARGVNGTHQHCGPGLFPQGRRLPVGLSGAHPRSGIHPIDREGRDSDAYMLDWQSNVFPGILGRPCDRPCEPACRRGRVENEPVAICRLKRVAADFKDDLRGCLPRIPREKNGKRIALVGAGPASLTVARDLMPLGYHCVLFDGDTKGGGMMRTQIPRFRLPETVTDEEVDLILDMEVETRFGELVGILKALMTHA